MRITAPGGYWRRIPRGRRMSSAWTIVSPSQESTGPGGCLTEVSSAWKRRKVSAGVAPLSAATFLSCSRSKLNRAPASLTRNAGGVIFAVAVMWATTSRTVQEPQREGLAHWSGPMAPRSIARASRSAWITGQISVFSIVSPSRERAHDSALRLVRAGQGSHGPGMAQPPPLMSGRHEERCGAAGLRIRSSSARPGSTPSPVVAGGPTIGWGQGIGVARGDPCAVRRQWRGEDLVHPAGDRVSGGDTGAGRDALERAVVGDGGDQPADRVRRAVPDDRDGPAQRRPVNWAA